jgi:hypothetical protein
MNPFGFRTFCILLAAGRAFICPTILSAQGPCFLDGPPDRYGELNYVGQADNVFDYWSDAGEHGNKYYFQLGVKNEGKGPLTIDWAYFFRRGIPPKVEARSECLDDGNTLNVYRGIIKYGPLTQFNGPNARFYQFQRAPSGTQTDATSFEVNWRAILDSGEPYPVSFKVQAALTADRQIEYVFSNFQAPIEVEWSQVLTQPVLLAAQKLNQPPTIRDGRLVLARTQSLRFSFSGEGIRRQSAPLSVFIPNGPLLYRDAFAGLTFTQVTR